MNRLLISGFVAIALLALMTTMRSVSISRENYAVTTGAVSWKKPLPAIDHDEEFGDRALASPLPLKR
jgi:hypothetical protein